MIKLTLKATGLLLIIAAFSTPTLAQSPWAVKKTVVEDDTPADTAPADTADTPAEQQSSPSPAVEADSSYSTVEEIEQPPEDTQPEYSQTEVTEQRGDVLDTPAAPQNDDQNYGQNTAQDQSGAVHLLDFPVRGMSTDKVKNELGAPTEVLPAIGQPPITRWIYNDRTVYFEYSAVIHVVANQ
ncbi:MAG TPA: hypothetical protein ENJ08_15150 [Gammaproteobacteria bacterium]|nr:hypothetical protein [Gammaproteobacteria bacterium]